MTEQQIREAYAWYTEEPSRTLNAVADRYGMTRIMITQRFNKLSLSTKQRSDYKGLKYGESAPNWKGGRTITAECYVKIKIDPNDPYINMAEPHRRYVLEHRYVMAQYLGRALYDWETVHHNDGNKQNNDIANLQLRIGKHGKGQVYECMDCGSRRLAPTDI